MNAANQLSLILGETSCAIELLSRGAVRAARECITIASSKRAELSSSRIAVDEEFAIGVLDCLANATVLVIRAEREMKS